MRPGERGGSTARGRPASAAEVCSGHATPALYGFGRYEDCRKIHRSALIPKKLEKREKISIAKITGTPNYEFSRVRE
jgi:hypothetical protein